MKRQPLTSKRVLSELGADTHVLCEGLWAVTETVQQHFMRIPRVPGPPTDHMMLLQSYVVVTLAPAGVRVCEWGCQKLAAEWHLKKPTSEEDMYM